MQSMNDFTILLVDAIYWSDITISLNGSDAKSDPLKEICTLGCLSKK